MIRVRLQIGGNGGAATSKPALYRPQPLAFAASFVAHAAFGLGLLHIPIPTPAAHTPALRYKVTMLPPEQPKLVYYPPRHLLPDISPPEAGKGPAPRGREKSPDTLIATSKRPNAGKQLIWLPAPEIKTPIERRLPNLIAVAPQREVAPPPPRKIFVPPKPETPPLAPAARLLDAPGLNLKVNPPAGAVPEALRGNLQAPPKPAPRAFTPPPAPKLTYGQPAVISDAPPEIAGVTPGGTLGNVPGAASGARRRFIPPPPSGAAGGGSAPGGASGAVVEAPPELQVSGGTQGAHMAIVGLNPATKLEGALPQYSQPADFSRAPNTGAPSHGVAGAGDILVPGLTVRGGGSGAPASPAPPPPVPAAPQKVVVFETRMLQPGPILSAPLRPAARTLPAAIESRFATRLVYTAVLEKPKLPDYADDWVLWFAETEPVLGDAPQMRAPIPLRKLETAGQPPRRNGPRQDHRIRLAARIGKDGIPSQVAALSLRPSEFDKRAIEDLRKWEFRPALRNGQPVAVDVVLEIPFSFDAAP